MERRCFTPSATACGGASSLKEGALENDSVLGAEARAEPLPYTRTLRVGAACGRPRAHNMRPYNEDTPTLEGA